MDQNQKEEKEDDGHRVQIQPSLTCEKGKHFFMQISGMEIKCQKCPIGYGISGGTTIRDGKVYIHGQFVC